MYKNISFSLFFLSFFLCKMTATIKFASYFWDRKRMSQDSTSLQALLTESSEDDQKLQDDLDIMLSSLNIHEMTKETDAFTLQEALHGLIEKIQQATRQTLDNQIVDPSSQLQRQLDVASLGGLVDRMNKRRLVDQVKIYLFFLCIIHMMG